MDPTDSVTSASGLRQVAQALRQAGVAGYDRSWSMPAAFYNDPAVLDVEREQLFSKEWICIGRADEIPEPGSSMSFQLCDEPLVAVRDADDTIRVLSNVCRHRGALLVTGKGSGSHLMCPYHQWSYELDGRLARAPRMETHAEFEPAACRLPEFACEQWMGFIFVSLNPDPAPLTPRLADLEAKVCNYHMEEMATRFVSEEVWPTNWKGFIENFMEAYHLTPLHSATLHSVNPTRLTRHFPPGDAYFGYLSGFSPDLPRVQGHPDLAESEANDCVMYAIPPGLVSGCAADYSSFVCIQPETADTVRLKMGLMFYGDRWTDDAVDKAIDLFIRTNEEDRQILLDMGRGRRSAHLTPGAIAPNYEGTLVDLYHYLDRRLASALPRTD